MTQTKVAVVTDSTADLPPTLRDQLSVTVVPLTVTVGGESFLDGVEILPEEFYRRLAASGSVASTSQPSAGMFAEAYRQALSDHDQVLSLHISAKLSGTYQAAVQGAELAQATERVTVVDTGLVSMPLALVVLAAAELAADGRSVSEVVEKVSEIARETRVYFLVGTLEQLRRGGRIGRASALVGSVLQVKPLLTIADGEVGPLERVRTRERAISRLIELAGAGDERCCAIVGHACSEDAAQRVAGALAGRSESLLVSPLGPVVGAHAGRGTVGVGLYPAVLYPLGLSALRAAAAT
ncbi:MAG: DegV family protein [Candidatus Dormibacteraeota bacterium]|nr:DegV family protein [Candidatus Dormibacteraeota bacterium]